MTRFARTILIIWAALIVFTAVFYALVHIFVMDSILELERRGMCRDVERLRSALKVSLDRIGYSVVDWAEWDDSYQFVAGQNERFRESLLTAVSYAILNLNMIVFVDTSDRMVYGTFFDPATRAITPVPEAASKLITQESKLHRHPPGLRGTEGILMVAGRPMLAAAHPILTSKGAGPARGTLVFGQWLDEKLVRHISEMTLLRASVLPLGSQLPADFGAASRLVTKKCPVVVVALSSLKIAGYGIEYDLRGRPAVMLRVVSSRGIYRTGRRLVGYLLTALALLSLLFGATTTALLMQARRREREVEAQQSEFYRRTILAATEGKLVISDYKDVTQVQGTPIAYWEVRKPADVGSVRDEVRRIAASEGMDESRIDDLAVCVGELTTNALNHAGGGGAFLSRSGDSLICLVSDSGPGIQAVALPHVALELGYTTAVSLGVGYKLLVSLGDRVYLATGPEGTTVAVKMGLQPRPEEDAMVTFSERWGV